MPQPDEFQVHPFRQIAEPCYSLYKLHLVPDTPIHLNSNCARKRRLSHVTQLKVELVTRRNTNFD
ncbi:MAG: hypothetical protein CMJ94_07395 [Planctomycetes bacterium]|nr:hypothetical protein [Planctomycetota bacterium]